MADRTFSGVFPILQMPFDDAGQILYEDLRAEVEYAVRGGVHGVGIAYGSEINKLDDHERDEVLSAVVDQAEGRIKVVMNTGAPSTVQAVHYTRVAKVLGADAVMIAPPVVPGIATSLVHQHFLEIAESTDLPIFMQDMRSASLSPARSTPSTRHPLLSATPKSKRCPHRTGLPKPANLRAKAFRCSAGRTVFFL